MEPLPDPLDDRVKKDILPPPQLPLKTELLYLDKTSKLIFKLFFYCRNTKSKSFERTFN